MGDVDRYNARLYLIGLGASLLGNSAMTLVAGIWVKSLTGSSAAAAVVSVCVYAPSLLGPVAGALADRLPRRRLLVAINLASAAVVTVLLLVHSPGQVWLIDIVMLGYGLSEVLNDPAEKALFAAILPTPLRRRFNGVRLALQEGGKLVAPLLGAGLFALLGGGSVAALDAATFLFAALLLTRLRISDARPRPIRRDWRADLFAGFGHIRRVPELRTTLVATMVAMIVTGIAFAAQYSLVDALHRPPSFLGLLTGALGAGSIIASLTSARMIGRFGEQRLAWLGLLNGVLGYLLWATGVTPAALVGAFVRGFALPWTFVATINLAQRRTPDALQGRVAAAVTLALFAPQPLAQAAGALAIGHLGYRVSFLDTAVVTLATAVWLARRRDVAGPSEQAGEFAEHQ